MGGAGSGHYPRPESETTVSQCRALDVNELNRNGFLDPGTTGAKTWLQDEEEIASLGYRRTTTPDGGAALRLSYTITKRGGEKRVLGYCVPLTSTECNFGGTRPWFVCPGAACNERVGKLYRPPAVDHYLCRHCHNLSYESSQRSGTDFYENVLKPLNATDAAHTPLEDGDAPLDRERLKTCYEAWRELDAGLAKEFGDQRPVTYLSAPSTFDEWCDRLFRSIGIAPGYSVYGRCEATAKTTGERCRQSAIGHHGKCYYHGGGPGSGTDERQRDHAQERVDTHVIQSENERREDTSSADNPLATRADHGEKPQ